MNFLEGVYGCFGGIFRFFFDCFRDKNLGIYGIFIEIRSSWLKSVFLFRKISLPFFRKILTVYNKMIKDEFFSSVYLGRYIMILFVKF